ncbi:MAG TPA: extracellular solute-binding protein [Caldilineaceae bacterium]|nr:extracellular solute-binding protein [Caldilineaceae bacterium]
MKTSKSLLLLTLLLISALLTAQCGGAAQAPAGGEQPAAQPQEQAQEEAAAGEEQIELRLWMHQNTSFIAANEELIRRFEEQHPNVNITLESFPYDVYIQTLQTAMPAGTEADIMELFGSWVCGYSDRLAELPDTVMAYTEAQEVFYQAPLDGYYCDGKLYGLPQEFNIENGAVLVNPALFEAAGVPYPPQWESMEDLLTDAQQLAQRDGDTMTVSGFHFISGDGLAFQFLAGILQRGGEYWKPDGSGLNFMTEEARATLEDMKSWVDDYQVTDPFLFNSESNWVGDAFFQNLVAIGFIGPWVVPEGRSQFPDLEFDYVRLPNYAGDQHLFAADAGWGKVVSPNSQHPEMAFEFVKFATAEAENARVWNVATGTVPALKSVATDPSLLNDIPWIEASLQVLDYGRYVGPLPDRDLFWYEIVYPHILAMLQGSETVDQTLEAIDAEANAMFQ